MKDFQGSSASSLQWVGVARSAFPKLCALGHLTSSALMGRRRQWHPTPVLLPGKSYGWRSLVGCSPWGHEESDTTK